jgi:hypothetical protein
MKNWSVFLIENDIQSIVNDVESLYSKQVFQKELAKHPDWLQGILNFKQTNPDGYAKSMANFKHNAADERLIEKLASGEILGYYDFM